MPLNISKEDISKMEIDDDDLSAIAARLSSEFSIRFNIKDLVKESARLVFGQFLLDRNICPDCGHDIFEYSEFSEIDNHICTVFSYKCTGGITHEFDSMLGEPKI